MSFLTTTLISSQTFLPVDWAVQSQRKENCLRLCALSFKGKNAGFSLLYRIYWGEAHCVFRIQIEDKTEKFSQAPGRREPLIRARSHGLV